MEFTLRERNTQSLKFYTFVAFCYAITASLYSQLEWIPFT